MKKIAVLLAVVLLVSMLGGCYKSDLVFDFDQHGGVEVTNTVLTEKDVFSAYQISTPSQMIMLLEMLVAQSGLPESGEKVELVAIKEDGTQLAEGDPLPTDGSMVGLRLRMKYKSIEHALGSVTMGTLSMAVPFEQTPDGYGLKIEEKPTLYGTKYVASGKISVYSDGSGKQMADQFTGASNTVTFKFPLCFGKNGDKTFVGKNLSYTVTNDNPEQDIYFEVTVINPLVLGMGIAILILLVTVIVLLCLRKKKKADAFFVDADGNEIPVFDVEDDEFEEVEEAEEAEELLEESGEEIAELEETEEESKE